VSELPRSELLCGEATLHFGFLTFVSRLQAESSFVFDLQTLGYVLLCSCAAHLQLLLDVITDALSGGTHHSQVETPDLPSVSMPEPVLQQHPVLTCHH